jgi:hypothetical protein
MEAEGRLRYLPSGDNTEEPAGVWKCFRSSYMNIHLRVEFSPLVIQHEGTQETDTKAILRAIERLRLKIMDFSQALDLLTTNVDDLDASIQEEIRQFEELKDSQGGTLTEEQQTRFDALVARIQQQKVALDADDATPEP